MKLRKITSVALSIFMIFSFASCGFIKIRDKAENTTEESTEDSSYNIQTEQTSAVIIPESTVPQEVTTAVPESEKATEPQSENVTSAATEPAAPSTAEAIAAFYKEAVRSTGGSVSSSQTIELSDISVNNGALGGMFSFVTPILSKFLSSSATVTEGITGDTEKLTASDISSFSAYKSDRGTIVQMKLNTQSGNASESPEGSVSHAISVVGDLGSIMLQLKDAGLPIEISVEKAVISYTDPVVNVLIGEDGKIINGTWSCNVEINLSDYTFAGARVDSTRVVLKNTITVNGGFSQ